MRHDRSAEMMLRRISEGTLDLHQVAGMFSLTLYEMAAWAFDPENRRALRGLRLLSDMQAQLVISRYRLAAAARLVALATQDNNTEVARKACVDVLRLDVMPRPRPKVGEAEPVEELAPPLDTEAVLKALREIGEKE